MRKRKFHIIFCLHSHIYKTIYFGRFRWLKLAQLHRAKERTPLSLSNQVSVCTVSLKVAWSGISLINRVCSKPPRLVAVTMTTLRQTNQSGVTAGFRPYLSIT